MTIWEWSIFHPLVVYFYLDRIQKAKQGGLSQLEGPLYFHIHTRIKRVLARLASRLQLIKSY